MQSHAPSPFGEVFKAFRKRRHLTQQEIAAQAGVHYNTVGRWERGDVLPESRGVVIELAKLLQLDGWETRQLLEASLTAPAPYWHIPFPRNPLFTGREEILETLHQRLSPTQIIALTQSYALHGLGGIGKTQLAVEYAYRYALEYDALLWIGAESVEQIITSFIAIAELLRLPERQETDQQRIIAAVQRWLTTHSKWLLIWDNLEDPELLQRFLPSARQGTILITTRCQAIGTLAQGLELPTMTPEEGMILLLRRGKILNLQATREQMHQLAISMSAEYAAAQALVTLMGGLPLALDQAGAYVEETGCSLSDYLQRYEQQRAQLLQRRGMLPGDHPQSIAATFLLAFERVERIHPSASELLRWCAFLHADAIPEEIFAAGASHLGPVLGPVAANPLHLDLAIAALRSLSLVQRHSQTRTLSIHRLVQAVLQEEMSEQERAEFQRRVIRRLNAFFPEVTDENSEVWEQCERFLPHVLICALAIPDHVGDQDMVEVLRKAADYLRDRAQYEQAEPLYRRALRIGEQALEAEHPALASVLYGLARLCHDLGKYEQAESFYQRALCIREQTLGPEHPQVAASLNGLAVLYYQQGKYEQAELLHQRTLRIREQALGPDHPQVAVSLNNLALLYALQGKYEQAEPLYQRTLRIVEQTVGPEHPHYAYPLNNFAELYALQGKYEQAEPLYQRALHLWEHALGPEHPAVAHPLNGLADLYCQQGRYEEAEPLYQRAQMLGEQHLGQDHPETARSQAGLARLYEKQGNYKQAEPLLQRACMIFEQRLGRAHPETVKAMNDYRRLLERRRRTTEEQQEHTKPLEGSSRQIRSPLSVPSEEAPTAEQETDPLKDFLASCCELHPRSWCRSADLWQTYEDWVEKHQERFPLSRGVFIAQLKAHGCRADRTKTARIWRGIAIVKKER